MFTRGMLRNTYTGGAPIAAPLRNVRSWSKGGVRRLGSLSLTPKTPNVEHDWLDKQTWSRPVLLSYRPRGL